MGLQKLKSDFLGQMEHRLSAMIDDVMDNLHKTEYPERVLMMSDPSMMRDKRCLYKYIYVLWWGLHNVDIVNYWNDRH